MADPVVQHYDRVKRRAMVRMAQATGIKIQPWAHEAKLSLKHLDVEEPQTLAGTWIRVGLELSDAQLARLWDEVAERMAGGVGDPSTPILGDPFGVFLTGICQRPHEGKGWRRQTAVVKTGARVDQTEGEKIIAHLKAQPDVNLCETCGGAITTWQADNTRISTFAAQEKELVAKGIVSHTAEVRGGVPS